MALAKSTALVRRGDDADYRPVICGLVYFAVLVPISAIRRNSPHGRPKIRADRGSDFICFLCYCPVGFLPIILSECRTLRSHRFAPLSSVANDGEIEREMGVRMSVNAVYSDRDRHRPVACFADDGTPVC